MVILPCLRSSQLLWHQAGSRELPWAGWGVGCGVLPSCCPAPPAPGTHGSLLSSRVLRSGGGSTGPLLMGGWLCSGSLGCCSGRTTSCR